MRALELDQSLHRPIDDSWLQSSELDYSLLVGFLSMPQIPNADELIATAMQLPLSERVALANAMLNSIEPSTGSDATQEEVDAAWEAEIANRIDDIDSGRVKTVPSSEVWKRIGGKPSGPT